jgi:hypothetical protein
MTDSRYIKAGVAEDRSDGLTVDILSGSCCDQSHVAIVF